MTRYTPTEYCVEPILGSLKDLTTYKGGGRVEKGRTDLHFVKVPCGLTTTHWCPDCNQPICRWHMVAQHDHTPAERKKRRP